MTGVGFEEHKNHYFHHLYFLSIGLNPFIQFHTLYSQGVILQGASCLQAKYIFNETEK